MNMDMEKLLNWANEIPEGNFQWIEIKWAIVLSTLQKYSGNRTHSAAYLGISLRTLRHKLNEMRANGISVPDNHSQHIITTKPKPPKRKFLKSVT